MSSPDSDPAERAAFRLVPRVLGADLEPFDYSGRQGVVDALLHFPDGRTAALEVSSAAADGRRQLYGLLARTKDLPNPGKWFWWASVDDPIDLPELISRYARIILFCERHEITHPEHAHEHLSHPDIKWLINSSASLRGTPTLTKVDGNRERPLLVTQGVTGGGVNDSLAAMNAAITDLLSRPHLKKRIQKLARSGHQEQHLFILVDDSALPSSIAFALMDRDRVPTDVLMLPGTLTHLWLLIAFAPRLLLATDTGWKSFLRSEYEDAPVG